ncbi:MAG: Crp/Fnr family transcriptional regulator [Methylococcales bacterium]|nr:Crp/Fnr family transcriptional regulator [Methylococcales bacterium]
MKPNKYNNQANKEVVNHCQQCLMRPISLFSDLQESDFYLLRQPINIIELEAEEILYKEKQVIRYLYTVRSGLLKQVRYLDDGSYRIVRLLRQGDIAGIEALNNTFYKQHTLILQKASLCQIPIKNIKALDQKSTCLYKPLMARWQKIQQDADLWITEFSVGHSKKRMANLLIYLAGENDTDFFFLPSREDIGALLAIRTETASRIIAEFKRQGCLQAKGNYAKINFSKLKQFY